MKAVSATFNGSLSEYTYLTDLDLAVGDICITKAPKGLAAVTISAIPATVPVDPEAKFEYKKLTIKVTTKQVSEHLFVAAFDDSFVESNTKQNAIAGLIALLTKPKEQPAHTEQA